MKLSDHSHSHPRTHSHDGHVHTHAHPHHHNHDTGREQTSRRDFMRLLMGGALAGASVLELAFHRAAWLRSRAACQRRSSLRSPKRPPMASTSPMHARKPSSIATPPSLFVSRDVIIVNARYPSPPPLNPSSDRSATKSPAEPVRYVINTTSTGTIRRAITATVLPGENVRLHRQLHDQNPDAAVSSSA